MRDGAIFVNQNRTATEIKIAETGPVADPATDVDLNTSVSNEHLNGHTIVVSNVEQIRSATADELKELRAALGSDASRTLADKLGVQTAEKLLEYTGAAVSWRGGLLMAIEDAKFRMVNLARGTENSFNGRALKALEELEGEDPNVATFKQEVFTALDLMTRSVDI